MLFSTDRCPSLQGIGKPLWFLWLNRCLNPLRPVRRRAGKKNKRVEYNKSTYGLLQNNIDHEESEDELTALAKFQSHPDGDEYVFFAQSE